MDPRGDADQTLSWIWQLCPGARLQEEEAGRMFSVHQQCSLVTSNFLCVCLFSYPHPGCTSHSSAHLFPPGLTLSSTFCFLITLNQHRSWPYPRPPWSFLRCLFSASAPTAICLIISIFLLKNPRSDFSWWVLRQTGFLYDPAVLLLGVFPKDLKVGT